MTFHNLNIKFKQRCYENNIGIQEMPMYKATFTGWRLTSNNELVLKVRGDDGLDHEIFVTEDNTVMEVMM